LKELLELIVVEADMIQAGPLKEPVSADPDDDKFIACALASGARLIVSGDKHLLDVAGHGSIEVLKPRAIVDRHLLN
jgi:predicted nucleic acid-binding protein